MDGISALKEQNEKAGLEGRLTGNAKKKGKKGKKGKKKDEDEEEEGEDEDEDEEEEDEEERPPKKKSKVTAAKKPKVKATTKPKVKAAKKPKVKAAEKPLIEEVVGLDVSVDLLHQEPLKPSCSAVTNALCDRAFKLSAHKLRAPGGSGRNTEIASKSATDLSDNALFDHALFLQ
ncbi:hypothetical protein AC578_3131 [Pseudocercospora eumusae]|uniref:Uncharacterized protein n=1 Tax=Pseudocercospora eumusae TaxID=321146 RepID=A0A139H6B5_9PEZI|nr:hypothetical protein AC578_3131 [Pseudocercospora eumusae]